MIRTGIADIRSLCETDTYRKYYACVPEFRREKADRIRDWKKKAQSIGVWILYEKLREMWKLSETAPYNLSHSGDYVLCSIEDGREKEIENVKVGCDLQERKSIPFSLVRKYFQEEEQRFILEQESILEQEEAFFRYWTLKESFMKATREGMKLGLRAFEIHMEEKGPRLVRVPERIEETYYLKEYFLEIPYQVAVCATDRKFAEEIQKVTL